MFALRLVSAFTFVVALVDFVLFGFVLHVPHLAALSALGLVVSVLGLLRAQSPTL